MKQLLTLFIFCLCLGGTAFAQDAPSAREIGDAYIEATGGKEAWLAVKAIKMEGKATMQGMEFPVTILNAEGNKQYINIDVQGQKIVQAYDGKTAWQIMPFMGINEPTEMSDEEAEQFKDQHFLSEFIDSEKRGFKLELAESKEVEGTPTYAVHVSNEEGYDRTYYFDTEYMIPVMVSSIVKAGPQKGATTETYMSDYEEVGEIVMPKFLEVKFNGQSVQKITVDKVMVNPEIDVTIFDLKKDEGK